jgi:hypothetical protein
VQRRRTARESSFPYLSGDGLRLIADVVIEGEPAVSGSDRGSLGAGIVFAEPHVTRSETGLVLFESMLSAVETTGRPATLILHNGDVIPEPHALTRIADSGRRIYSVNAMDSSPGVTPIPIGLENAHHGRGGQPQAHLALRLDRQRDIPVLGCFNPATNPAARDPIRRALERSRHGFVLPGMSNAQHLELLSRARLVISPPGNGPDCHRTWEAIAAGAVPVVLRGSLASSLSMDAPILVVDDVQEALDMSDEQIGDLHERLSRRSRRVSLLPHWIDVILHPDA